LTVLTVLTVSRLTVVTAILLASAAIPATAAQDGGCETFQVYTRWHGNSSTVVRMTLPSGSSAPVGQIGYEVNAIGYAASQNLVYGVSGKSHVITISRAGVVTDRGKVTGLYDVTAGAALGTVLYLLDGLKLVLLDINPASPSYLKVLKTKWLSWQAHEVHDFDFGPDGQLYGVTGGTIVTINPTSGAVRKVATPWGLPYHGTYGSVVLAPGRILYTINNEAGRLYRIALDTPGSATQVTSVPVSEVSDASGCLAPPVVQPPPPPPAPPPAPRPPAPAKTTPAPVTTTTRSPAGAPVPVPPSAPPPETTTPPRNRTHPTPKPMAQPVPPDTQKKRRWALTILVLIFGAGTAVAGIARSR
jgi:hypothetical protein